MRWNLTRFVNFMKLCKRVVSYYHKFIEHRRTSLADIKNCWFCKIVQWNIIRHIRLWYYLIDLWCHNNNNGRNCDFSLIDVLRQIWERKLICPFKSTQIRANYLKLLILGRYSSCDSVFTVARGGPISVDSKFLGREKVFDTNSYLIILALLF